MSAETDSGDIRRELEENGLDIGRVAALVLHYCQRLPRPYFEMMDITKINSLEDIDRIAKEIDADPNLDAEQQYVLHRELDERRRIIALVEAAKASQDAYDRLMPYI